MSENSREISLSAGKEGNPAIKLSAAYEPLVKPSKLPRILVIGGGISGLMTAWILLDKGYRVTVISKEWAWNKDFQHSRLTSQIAGALWEYPPGGCGITEIESPGANWATVNHYREWSLESYELYKQMNSLLNGRLRVEFGVAITRLNQFFYHDLSKPDKINQGDYDKLQALKADGKRVDHIREQKNPQELKPIFDSIRVPKEWREKLKYGYSHDAPIINTDKAMAYLIALVQSKGADLETRELHGKLKDVGSELLVRYDAKAIVNATGLAAKELVGDADVYPVRGAIKRILNNNTNRFEAINEAYLVPAQKGDDEQPTKVVFLVPRNDETLVVGSIVQPYSDQLVLSENSPDVEVMWDRACSFMPGLDDASTVPWYPLAQGLRPFTKKNVKVRADEIAFGDPGNGPLIHNYGHGGSGWTLAVGCARSAVNLLELMLAGQSADEANKTLYPMPESKK